MRLNFLSKQSNKAQDPVCLMKVEKDENALNYEYKGKTYYFCSENCKEQFRQNPDQFLS